MQDAAWGGSHPPYETETEASTICTTRGCRETTPLSDRLGHGRHRGRGARLRGNTGHVWFLGRRIIDPGGPADGDRPRRRHSDRFAADRELPVPPGVLDLRRRGAGTLRRLD